MITLKGAPKEKENDLKDMYNRFDLPEQKNIMVLHPFIYNEQQLRLVRQKGATTKNQTTENQ